MRARRLEDRIRELCGRAVTAQDSELAAVFTALQLALREHTDRLRELAAMRLATWQIRGTGISVVLPASRTTFLCAICEQPIPLEDSKVNEEGRPIHEECYVAKLRLGEVLPRLVANQSCL